MRLPPKNIINLLEIVSEINSYLQNVSLIKAAHVFKECPYCISQRIIRWGYYFRKIILGTSIKDLPVHRCRCKDCERTFSYLPPFLIRFKRYYLPYLEQALKQIIINGASYFEAFQSLVCCEITTLFTYAQYFINKGEETFREVRKALLLLLPSYSYEKDKCLFEAVGENKRYKFTEKRELLRKGLILGETLRKVLSTQNSLKGLSTLTLVQYTLG